MTNCFDKVEKLTHSGPSSLAKQPVQYLYYSLDCRQPRRISVCNAQVDIFIWTSNFGQHVSGANKFGTNSPQSILLTTNHSTHPPHVAGGISAFSAIKPVRCDVQRERERERERGQERGVQECFHLVHTFLPRIFDEIYIHEHHQSNKTCLLIVNCHFYCMPLSSRRRGKGFPPPPPPPTYVRAS